MNKISTDEVIQIMSTLHGSSVTVVYQNLHSPDLISRWTTDINNLNPILRLASLGLILEIKKHKKHLKNRNPEFIFYWK